MGTLGVVFCVVEIFLYGFLVLCVVRCGVWSVVWIFFFALGFGAEFVGAECFGLCFGFW